MMVALLFATKIIEGLWEFKDVPATWREEVRAILIAEGREDLISTK